MFGRISKILTPVLLTVGVVSTIASAAEKVISIVSETNIHTINVVVGDTFTVHIKVDDASVVAGAAFTVTYDTANLTLNDITSTFFGTFDAQLIDTPEDDGSGGYITVDSVKYYSPQIVNPIATGSMLAAVRFNNGSGLDESLFTLTFQATGTTGVYPISATQSVITNTNAGYTANSDDITNRIPFFVGIDGDTYPSHIVNTISGCTVTVSALFIDYDGDLIDDNWEIAYRPDEVANDATDVLDYFTATGDYDRDGYSDYQEYLNRNETDPENNIYNPKIDNASGGTGYSVKRIFPPGINLLLLN
jgi:hypothetical protein